MFKDLHSINNFETINHLKHLFLFLQANLIFLEIVLYHENSVESRSELNSLLTTISLARRDTNSDFLEIFTAPTKEKKKSSFQLCVSNS